VSTLAAAIKGKRWELASLCLLVGLVEAAAALPPDAVEELLAVLAGLEDEDDSRSRSTRSFDRLRTGRGRRR
jgi:hypothetical protein